jgi:hypothetical protein
MIARMNCAAHGAALAVFPISAFDDFVGSGMGA